MSVACARYEVNLTPALSPDSCPGGYYLDEYGRCRMCPAGHFSPGGDVPFCTHCPIDSYSDHGARHCTACPSGKVAGVGMGTSVEDCKGILFSIDVMFDYF